MIYSMTGYGKNTGRSNNFSFDIEVKSVNSRFLDIALKLPSYLFSKEYEIREIIKNKIKRGKISVIIQLKKNSQSGEIASINKEKVKEYLLQLKELKKTAKLTEKIKLEHLLLNKEIFAPEDSQIPEEDFSAVKLSLETALNDLLKMKKKEGSELKKDLEKRIKVIEEKLDVIEGISAKSVQENFEKLKERMQVLVENVTEYSDRLELELAVIADKAEITEECVRLRSHLKFFIESLEENEPGRKLNFLCQEMNREANTISSKTVSIDITHNAVLIKEEIEKLREQIQNIE